MGGPEMIAHHVAALLSIYFALSLGEGHAYTLALLATEMTTPFVNMRWILDVVVRSPTFLAWLVELGGFAAQVGNCYTRYRIG
jgi:TLC domain